MSKYTIHFGLADRSLLTILLFSFLFVSSAVGQPITDYPTDFTYQGYLEDSGTAASGTFDFRFRLFDSVSGGTQIGSDVTAENIPVENGVFSVVLDFGDVFSEGDRLFLAVAVRATASSDGYTTLSPRDALRPTPSAIVAHRALALRNVTVDESGNVGIGTETPSSTLTVDGAIETLSGGITFPDGTTQTSAGVGSSSDGWSLTGNGATNPADNFVGTTDDQPLELRVDNSRVLRLEVQTGFEGSFANILAGHESNSLEGFAVGATISGGGGQDFSQGGGSFGHVVAADYGTIGGGSSNTVRALRGTVGGGHANQAGTVDTETEGSVVGGGQENRAIASNTTVAGGISNVASADWASVLGGRSNMSSGQYASIVGGHRNESSGEHTSLGGGLDNTAAGDRSTVAGGSNNIADGQTATIGGGMGHVASASAATVAGGDENTASASRSSVGGGDKNTASGNYARVGGGINNTAEGSQSIVAGGHGNTATAVYSAIGGGSLNLAFNTASTVAGGRKNKARGEESFIGGGEDNIAVGNWSVIGGGNSNNTNGAEAVVSGGAFNNASGNLASIGGGNNNLASGEASTIPGGFSNEAQADYSFAAGWQAEVQGDHSGTFVWADSSPNDTMQPDNESFQSTDSNQFLIRAVGGVGIGTNAPKNQFHVRRESSGEALNVNHVALIENGATNQGQVLALKTDAATPSAAENFITFKSATANVGAIEGNGSGGVVLKSGGADFAEMLPRRIEDEVIQAGDVVGVVGGQISLDTQSAERLMVVSDRALVVGNEPGQDEERFEQIAFIGQVPIHVAGHVNVGDFIVASGEDDGLGRAISPTAWRPDVHGPVVGQAWEAQDEGSGRVNAAVGLDMTRPLTERLSRQQSDIDRLKDSVDELERTVRRLESLLEERAVSSHSRGEIEAGNE